MNALVFRVFVSCVCFLWLFIVLLTYGCLLGVFLLRASLHADHHPLSCAEPEKQFAGDAVAEARALSLWFSRNENMQTWR